MHIYHILIIYHQIGCNKSGGGDIAVRVAVRGDDLINLREHLYYEYRISGGRVTCDYNRKDNAIIDQIVRPGVSA